MSDEAQVVLVPDYLTVRELSDLIEASPIEVMKKLIANGIMASINQQIDFDTAAIVIEEMGFEALSESVVLEAEEKQRRVESSTQEWRKIYAEEKPENLSTRPPIITILGHVDHGKTTLLDTIRSTSVAEGEAGGITQHIGAYQVMHDGRALTFLDTPGHEAFTAMRARGATGADIAILVVAADDGVMPTTREALTHARAANVPIVVAITKVDKQNANPEVVKQELAELELIPDEWDGDTLMVPVAALQGEGIDDLLEALLLVSEDSDIVANPEGDVAGMVIEAQVDPSRGTLATVLLLNGTLKKGDTVIAGETYGRIKAMFDDKGQIITQATPSMPIQILGLNEPPVPGDQFEQVKNEKAARALIVERRAQAETSVARHRAPTLEDIFAQFSAEEIKELNLLVKVDVQGSLEPIITSLEDLSETNQEGISVRILASDVGNVSENDINLAGASGAIVIGFNVDIDNAARRAADNLGVDIRQYNVIYKLLEDVQLALSGMLEPVYEERTIGRAEVRKVFKISRVGAVAGSYILEGEIHRNGEARVLRGDRVIVERSGISSLKRHESDVREVRAGFECGISLGTFNDFEEGDIIECYTVERIS